MGHQEAGSAAAYPIDYTIPDDGDDENAASVAVALEALADRTEWLRAEVARLYPLPAVNWLSHYDAKVAVHSTARVDCVNYDAPRARWIKWTYDTNSTPRFKAEFSKDSQRWKTLGGVDVASLVGSNQSIFRAGSGSAARYVAIVSGAQATGAGNYLSFAVWTSGTTWTINGLAALIDIDAFDGVYFDGRHIFSCYSLAVGASRSTRIIESTDGDATLDANVVLNGSAVDNSKAYPVRLIPVGSVLFGFPLTKEEPDTLVFSRVAGTWGGTAYTGIPAGAYFEDVAHNGTNFLAVVNDGGDYRIYSSTDGFAWSSVAGPFANPLGSIAGNAKVWLVLTSGPSRSSTVEEVDAHYSVDGGATWYTAPVASENVDVATVEPWVQVVEREGRFVITTTTRVHFSICVGTPAGGGPA